MINEKRREKKCEPFKYKIAREKKKDRKERGRQTDSQTDRQTVRNAYVNTHTTLRAHKTNTTDDGKKTIHVYQKHL